ncbi:MAG: hypothetical protein BWZ10_02404 [candidate division BRC1 bacterium ADurb.BinA364]|nr:MAG: hypothetical protein BWZ10_02404 [candidate division BRC1 bacterium ADurb.BinA364]
MHAQELLAPQRILRSGGERRVGDGLVEGFGRKAGEARPDAFGQTEGERLQRLHFIGVAQVRVGEYALDGRARDAELDLLAVLGQHVDAQIRPRLVVLADDGVGAAARTDQLQFEGRVEGLSGVGIVAAHLAHVGGFDQRRIAAQHAQLALAAERLLIRHQREKTFGNQNRLGAVEGHHVISALELRRPLVRVILIAARFGQRRCGRLLAGLQAVAVQLRGSAAGAAGRALRLRRQHGGSWRGAGQRRRGGRRRLGAADRGQPKRRRHRRHCVHDPHLPLLCGMPVFRSPRNPQTETIVHLGRTAACFYYVAEACSICEFFSHAFGFGRLKRKQRQSDAYRSKADQ